MNAAEIVRLLEREWPNIRRRLGDRWAGFAAQYRAIVASLGNESGREDVERVADDVCELLSRDPFTRPLLQGWQGTGSERLLASARDTLADQEVVRQVCNRFQDLAANDPGPGQPLADNAADEQGQQQ